jgi:hypothetical protein
MRRLLVASLLATVLLVPFRAGGAEQAAADQCEGDGCAGLDLAMNGPRVAHSSGGKIHAWNVLTGATYVVKGNYSNAKHSVNAPSCSD